MEFSPLPIDAALPELTAALHLHNTAVLVAPPGAGKRHGVPLILVGEPWAQGRRILMLEPRRLAARAAAERMAKTLGERVGDTVGLRVGDEDEIYDNLFHMREQIPKNIFDNEIIYAYARCDEISTEIFIEIREGFTVGRISQVHGCAYRFGLVVDGDIDFLFGEITKAELDEAARTGIFRDRIFMGIKRNADKKFTFYDFYGEF